MMDFVLPPVRWLQTGSYTHWGGLKLFTYRGSISVCATDCGRPYGSTVHLRTRCNLPVSVLAEAASCTWRSTSSTYDHLLVWCVSANFKFLWMDCSVKFSIVSVLKWSVCHSLLGVPPLVQTLINQESNFSSHRYVAAATVSATSLIFITCRHF